MTDFNALDPRFAREITDCPGGENLKSCFSCGSCTAGCPISKLRPGYNPRKIIKQALLGFREEVLSSKELWYCLQCHTCVAHCPQDVRFADIMLVLRQLAVKEGYVSPETARQVDALNEQLYRHWIDEVEALL